MTRQAAQFALCSRHGGPGASVWVCRSRENVDRGGLVKYSRNALVRIVVVVAALALLLAACGSSSKNTGSGSTTTVAAKSGGSVVFGAEQWPDCINPITQCA